MEKQNFGFGMILGVKYCFKDKVKAAGAKWNNDIKTWYCPSNISDTSLNQLIELKDNLEVVFARTGKHRTGNHDDDFRQEYNTNEIKNIFIDYKTAQSLKPIFKKQIMNNIKHTKPDKIDYTKKNEIQNTIKRSEINFDSDEDEDEVKPAPVIKKQIIKKQLWPLACNYCKESKLSKEEIEEMKEHYVFN